MKSAATALLEMFGVTGRIRPASIESILVSLLFTLNKLDLLEVALEDIDRYTPLGLESKDNLDFIKSIASSPELVGLYNKQKALQFLLHIMPKIFITETYSVINIEHKMLDSIINRSNKSNRYREVKKLLQQINELNMGYIIIQPPNVDNNEFHILKANSRKEAIEILAKNGIQTPSVLDAALKGVL